MAVLTSTGITFNDSSVLNSKYGIIPQSKKLTFYQASAPTGWVQVTTHNDKAVRVVSGTGAGSGGSSGFLSSFISNFPYSGSAPITITGLTVGATTLSTSQIPAHTHPSVSGAFTNNLIPRPAPSPGFLDFRPRVQHSPGTSTGPGPSLGGGSHTHPVSYTSASGPVSGTINMLVNYVDVIICSFT